MSGHNPHGHLSQPNSSWNPLQVPYIPRQPQLAHMSNENSLVRSQLTWHTPPPPDPLYSIISASHKTLVDLNPFARGQPPFGSVDLTIQSTRNSTTPSPPSEFTHNKQIPRSLTPNSRSNSSLAPSPSVIQSTSSIRDKFQCPNGGNNGEIITPGNIFIRDTRQINDELAKMTTNRELVEMVTVPSEPVELIKNDPGYQSLKSLIVPTSPKRRSLVRQPSAPNNVTTPPPTQSPIPLLPNTTTPIVINNSHNTGTLEISNLSQKPTISVTSVCDNSQFSNPLPSPSNTDSNEDSVDSNGSKARRKRKPNKTIRSSTASNLDQIPMVENNDNTQGMDGNNEGFLQKSIDMFPSCTLNLERITVRKDLAESVMDDIINQNKKEHKIDIDLNKAVVANDCEKSVEILPGAIPLITQPPTPIPLPVAIAINDDVQNVLLTINDNSNSNKPANHADGSSTQQLKTNSQEMSVNSLETNKEHSTIDVCPRENSVESINQKPIIVAEKPCDQIDAKTDVCDVLATENDNVNICPTQAVAAATAASNTSGEVFFVKTLLEPSLESDSPRLKCTRKNDSTDDVETIDKIAAMIADSDVDTLPCENQLNKTNEAIAQDDQIEAQNNNSRISDLAKILETTPADNGEISKANSQNRSDGRENSSDDREKASNVRENLSDGKENLCDGRGNSNSNSSSMDITKSDCSTKKDSTEKDKAQSFEEVENKLEEMFAGIEDEMSTCLNPDNMCSLKDQQSNEDLVLGMSLSNNKNESNPENEKPTIEITKTEPILTPSTSSSKASQKRILSNKTEQSPPKKKRKIVKKPTTTPTGSSKTAKNKNKSNRKQAKFDKPLTKEKPLKEEILPEAKYKGPFVQIREDGTINVINGPLTEDDIEKQNKVKKSLHSQNNSDRSKIRGLHISTLSMKYDADTTDTTWMCVFCKKGPHKLNLGDLFGPYIITTTCEEFELSQKDPFEDEFISKRTKADMVQKHVNGMPVVPSSTSVISQATNVKKKRKTNDSPCLTKPQTSKPFDIKDIFIGMTKATETSYEVWIHEDCAVWSSGVHIINARILGLEASVWSSTRHQCSICSLNGAMIACLNRGCAQKAHIPCARQQNWILDERDFISICQIHAVVNSSIS